MYCYVYVYSIVTLIKTQTVSVFPYGSSSNTPLSTIAEELVKQIETDSQGAVHWPDARLLGLIAGHILCPH